MCDDKIHDNHYARMKKHKRRLKRISNIINSPFVHFAPELMTSDKYWKSIYNSWSLYKKRSKKKYHRRIRNVFKSKISRYMKDEDYELSYCSIEAY